uniref:Thioredoxin domain-containing protein n=1 Tax=viral metagenome TaxID=1070528 RepID=A0A6C0D0D6_9ZZZZ
MDDVEFDNLDLILFVLLFLFMISCMCKNIYSKTNFLLEGLKNDKDKEEKIAKRKSKKKAESDEEKARKKLDKEEEEKKAESLKLSMGTIDQLNANRGKNNNRLSDEEFYKENVVNKQQAQPPQQPPQQQPQAPQQPSPQQQPDAPDENVKGFISNSTLDDVPHDINEFHVGLPKNYNEIYGPYNMNNVYPVKDFSSFINLRKPTEISDKILTAPITYNRGIFDCLEQVNGFIPGASEQIEESSPQEVPGFITGATRQDDDDENNLVNVHIVWADWCGYSNKAMEAWPKMQSIIGDKHKDTKIIYKDILERDNKDSIGSGRKYDTTAFPYIFVMGNVNNKPVNEKYNAVETDSMVDKLQKIINKYY